jgi:hypothetical protein
MALSVIVLGALYIPFLGHGKLPVGSLGDYLACWRVNAPAYGALERFLPTRGLIVVPVALSLAVAFWTSRHLPLESPEAWAWPVATALFFAPAIFPWYLLWLTPFVFTPSTFPLAVWTVSSLSAYWWLPPWATNIVEYGTALGAAGWMLMGLAGARAAAKDRIVEPQV